MSFLEISGVFAIFIAFTVVWAYFTAKAIIRAKPEFDEFHRASDDFKRALRDSMPTWLKRVMGAD